MITTVKTELIEQVESALDTMRPFMKADGGDVELVDIDDNMIAKVRLLGACSSCNMSHMTMKAGVKEAVLKAVPELRGIVALD